jgi:hypothetical protein
MAARGADHRHRWPKDRTAFPAAGGRARCTCCPSPVRPRAPRKLHPHREDLAAPSETGDGPADRHLDEIHVAFGAIDAALGSRQCRDGELALSPRTTRRRARPTDGHFRHSNASDTRPVASLGETRCATTVPPAPPCAPSTSSPATTQTASELRQRVVGPVGLEPTTGGLKGRTHAPFQAGFACPSGPYQTPTVLRTRSSPDRCCTTVIRRGCSVRR